MIKNIVGWIIVAAGWFAFGFTAMITIMTV